MIELIIGIVSAFLGFVGGIKYQKTRTIKIEQTIKGNNNMQQLKGDINNGKQSGTDNKR